jgi:hypothetical protein
VARDKLGRSTRLDFDYQLEFGSLDRSLLVTCQIQVQVGVKGAQFKSNFDLADLDPQLLSQPIIPRIRDESLCSSTHTTCFTGPRIPSSAIASQDACHPTPALGTIELENCIDPAIERLHRQYSPRSKYVGITTIWGTSSN